MNLTVYTDASHNSATGLSTYAFTIPFKNSRIAISGLFKEKLNSSFRAEMRCILNALEWVISKSGYKPQVIYITTDSLGSIEILRKGKSLRAKQKELYKVELAEFDRLVQKTKAEVVLVHIYSHNTIESEDQEENNWCDQECKRLLKKYIKKLDVKGKEASKKAG